MKPSENPKPASTEKVEPGVVRSAVSMPLVVLLALAVYAGMVYFDSRGGWASPVVYSPYHSDEQVALFQPILEGPNLRNGKDLYEKNCAICHNSDGAGKPNQAPPFVGSEWVLGSPNRLIRIPLIGLNGPIKVVGQTWSLAMPAAGAALKDEDLADLLTYMRMSWGNKAEPITPDMIKVVRGAVASRGQPWTEAELLAVPER